MYGVFQEIVYSHIGLHRLVIYTLKRLEMIKMMDIDNKKIKLTFIHLPLL